ncbi:MAG: DNA repair protein RecO [Capsulimonadaceae bacterium]|nr:DNA repair protein RecO [Capsulimonadaceae bacterium]
MAQYNVTGIVLRRVPYGETDNIITLYTRERGRVSAIAKGARKPISRLAGACETLTCGRYNLAGGKSLDIVTQAEVKDAFPSLRKDLSRLAGAQYLAEALNHFVVEEDAHPDLFTLLRAGLLLMERADDPQTAVRWYELRLLELAGYGPDLCSCVICGETVPRDNASQTDIYALSVANGGALCTDHANPNGYEDHAALTFDALDYLQHLNAHGLEHIRAVAKIPSPSEATAGLARMALRRTIRWRIDGDLRSAPFMDSLLSPGRPPDETSPHQSTVA